MSQTAFTPGQIWHGLPLSLELLERQWGLELRHRAAEPQAHAADFTAADWADLEWNAREVLRLAARWPRAPRWWRDCFLPQAAVNHHLLYALQKLLGAWQQPMLAPRLRNTPALPPLRDRLLLLGQARGRLQAAMAKAESLRARGKALQQFSLRQWRLFQQVALLYGDLLPLAEGAAAELARTGCTAAGQMREDIAWHSRTLLARTGQPDHKPGLVARVRGPRIEMNRLAGAACLYHHGLLRLLQPVP